MEIRLQDEAWKDVEEGTEGLLDTWLIKEGEEVAAGQIIASVMVAKTTCELVAPIAGRVTKLVVHEQDSFGPDAVLAEIQGV